MDSLNYGSIDIYEKNTSNQIFTFSSNPQELPITISLNHKYKAGDFIPYKEIEGCAIGADVVNLSYGLSFRVKSFSVSITLEDQILKLDSSNFRFTKEQSHKIKLLKNNSPIIIHDIIIDLFCNDNQYFK